MGTEPLPTDPRPRLHMVGVAHLDTQWLWTVQDTIRDHLPRTLEKNFELFERFPSYQLSFEGAFRYMLIKEYYPDAFRRLRGWVRRKRWRVVGSFLEGCDVNLPSPEALIRQALLGNRFFQRELGVRCRDVFLPDCFGFGYALPTVAAHCGIRGFSTQKLAWGPCRPVPFALGRWEGPDGSTLLAALEPGSYATEIDRDLSASPETAVRLERQVAGGVAAGLAYYGTGDTGGAPSERSVEWLERSLSSPGPVAIHTGSPDDFFGSLTAEEIARLPRHRGELLLELHGTGCYTSRADVKRWNRMNERLAQAAEAAVCLASWLGVPAPSERLREAWTRFLWHQFHDDLPGTSIREAYAFTIDDQVVAHNQLRSLLCDAVAQVARALDTRAEGTALAVFNPLAWARQEPVEVEVPGRLTGVRVVGPEGHAPAQVLHVGPATTRVVFLARVPALGVAIYDVQPGDGPPDRAALRVTPQELQNHRYRVRLNAAGDVASVHDLRLGRELLRAPLRLELLAADPVQWPSWELPYATLARAPAAVVGEEGAPEVRVLEEGPVRVCLEVVRRCRSSRLVQRIRLGLGSERVELEHEVEWRERATLLKAAFPLAAEHEEASYDLGVGVIRRPVNTPSCHEVPAQEWADQTHPDGTFGVSVLNDCKYGWDKPDAGTLRQSLVYTPIGAGRMGFQGFQDLGGHRFVLALCGHEGDWAAGDVPRRAAELNQPLRAFAVAASPGIQGGAFGPGPLGRTLSLGLETDAPEAALVQAAKPAEDGPGDLILRLREASGTERRVGLRFAAPLQRAEAVDGMEEPIEVPPEAPLEVPHEGPLELRAREVRLTLPGFGLRALRVRLESPHTLPALPCVPVELPLDQNVVSDDGHPDAGDFDGEGHALPRELLPRTLTDGHVLFRLGRPGQQGGAAGPGKRNALACQGQVLELEPGPDDALYLLAAATHGDVEVTFQVDGGAVPCRIQSYHEPVGVPERLDLHLDPTRPAASLPTVLPALTKPDRVAWVGTHRHDHRLGNEPHVLCFLFRYRIDLPGRPCRVTLPVCPQVRLLSAALAPLAGEARLVSPA